MLDWRLPCQDHDHSTDIEIDLSDLFLFQCGLIELSMKNIVLTFAQTIFSLHKPVYNTVL